MDDPGDQWTSAARDAAESGVCYNRMNEDDDGDGARIAYVISLPCREWPRVLTRTPFTAPHRATSASTRSYGYLINNERCKKTQQLVAKRLRGEEGKVNWAAVATVIKTPAQHAVGGVSCSIECCVETALPRNSVMRKANGGARPGLGVRSGRRVGNCVTHALALAVGSWAAAKTEPLHERFVLEFGMYVGSNGHDGLYKTFFGLAR